MSDQLGRRPETVPADDLPHVSRFRSESSATGHRPPPPTARGRATLRTFETAARRVFQETGYLRSTVEEISKVAGKAPATFYTYFDSKEDLLGHLANQLAPRVLGAAGVGALDGDAPYEWFEAAAGAYWDAYVENAGVFVGVFQTAMVNEAFADRWRQMRRPGLDAIEHSIRTAGERGRTDLDPVLGASAIASMFEHFCYVWLAQGGESGNGPAPERATAVATLARLWSSALSSRG